jgi:hypothetical protein
MGKTVLVENAGDLDPRCLFSKLFQSRFSVVYFHVSGETLDAALDGLLGKQLRKSGAAAASAAVATAAAAAAVADQGVYQAAVYLFVLVTLTSSTQVHSKCTHKCGFYVQLL